MVAMKFTRLADCCTIKPPKSEARKRLRPEDLVSFVPMNSLRIDSKTILLDEDRPLSSVSGSYTYFADNDVLVAKITPCFENGKLGVARGLTNGIGFGSSEFFVLRPSDSLLPEYLYYFLLRPEFRLSGRSVMTGAVGHKRVPKEYVADTRIPLPSVDEQKRIVAILDQAFADIDRARELTEKNLNNARELFESYLQQVFSQRGEGWEEKTLKDISLEFGRGKSKHRPRNDESLYGGKYPFIQTGDVRNCKHTVTNYSKTYNEKGLSQSKLWPKGTICITIAANIAETGILGFDGCFPDSVIGIVVNPGVATTSYVEYLLQSYKLILQAKGKGSAQDNINLATFENMPFPFPSTEEQRAIVDALNGLMKSVEGLERIYNRKLCAIAELKKALLQKAFNGELTETTPAQTEAVA